jgi:hypothetical protein
MTDRSTLLELAERCEKATGPDRALDEAIARVVSWRPDGLTASEKYPPWWFADAFGMPRYTASLDAAMTLAMPHWWWNASAPLSEAAYGWSREDQRQPRAGFEMIGEPYSVGARAATVPLAICAAALRALANQPEDQSQ